MKLTPRALLPVTAGLLVAGVALASNVHMKPPRSNPAFFDHELTLSAAGSLSGLGNATVLITLDATAQPTGTCTNPAGATQPPGRNPAQVQVTGSQAIPASKIKNGTVSFSVETDPPQTPVAGAPDCPNTNWSEEITDMSFTSASMTVQQPPGITTTVLTAACSFNPRTSDGSVPGGTVTCTIY